MRTMLLAGVVVSAFVLGLTVRGETEEAQPTNEQIDQWIDCLAQPPGFVRPEMREDKMKRLLAHPRRSLERAAQSIRELRAKGMRLRYYDVKDLGKAIEPKLEELRGIANAGTAFELRNGILIVRAVPENLDRIDKTLAELRRGKPTAPSPNSGDKPAPPPSWRPIK